MDRVRSSLAASFVAVGLIAAACGSSIGSGSGAETARPGVGVPRATVLLSTGRTGHWIQTRRLDGTGVRDVTRRVARGEARFDEDASFSPDGTTVAFVRGSTGDRLAVMVARRNGTGIRRVLTLAQATRVAPRADRLRGPLFAPGGRSLVVEARQLSCSTEAILSVSLDGGPPATLWRRPKGELMTVTPAAVLPDGTVVAVASKNDGDCYFGHTGPDRVMLLHTGAPPRTLGPSSSAVGDVVVAADGRTVLWAADCYEACQIWAADVETGATRRLTGFRTRTMPLDGYDSIAMALLGQDALVYGRGRSVYVRSVSGRPATPERIIQFPCPREKGCHLSAIESIVTSPDGAWMIVDVADYGSEVWHEGLPEPIFERFAVEIASKRTARLPLLEFSDLRFD